ncbi:MAG: hypothetical protein K2X81_22255, partial [Candidatus Obscuribacterales bacterium]|nr:hypothetical protein [Candidatus Obscuribacterales bacterium]
MVSSGDSASHFTAGSGKDVLIHTLKDMPEAASLLAADAWNSPGKFALNTAKTLGESAVVGAAMGYIIPSSSLAAKLATVVFTAPIVYGTAKSITEAYNDGNKPGANIDALSKNLASNLTNEGWNFALGTAGSYAGAMAGHRIASS